MIRADYPDNLDDLLDRFAGGECTPAEADVVARWLDADPTPPARRERLARFRRLWEASRWPAGGPAETWDVDGAWRRAAERIAPAKIPVLTPGESERPRRAVWVPARARWAAAAMLVAGAAAAIGVAAVNRLSVKAGAVNLATAAPAREYVTARAERAVLTLTDGTRVVLGAASKLTVPPDYGRSAGPRVVTLDGEGYFEAVHDTAHPFIVRVGRNLVRDIGTKFVVRAYAPDRSVIVAVTEGEVLLANALLRQGNLGRLDSNGVAWVRRGADLRPYTSWIEGRLVFDDTPLAEAIPALERWFDIEITVADSSLYNRRLFATIGSEPVSRVLDLVALSLDLRVTRQGRTITLARQRQ